MRRTHEESGFTLVELITVVVVIGVLIAIAVPTFLSFKSPAQTAAAESNVRSAMPVAEKYAGSTGLYTGISGAALRTAAPGTSLNLKAVAVNSNKGYCLQDTENSGATYYNYVGGTPGAALKPGYSQAVIQPGTCLQAVGVAAS